MPSASTSTRRRALYAVSACLGTLFPVAHGAAHDLWLEREGDHFVLQYGHRHSGHEGEARVPYDPGVVREIHCVAIDGTLRAIAPGNEYPVRIAGDCAALHVVTSSGYWTRTTHGLRNQPASELPGVLRSWASIESVKHLEAWSEALSSPIGTGLELTLLEDPFALEPGAKLRLVASFEGSPRKGVTVTYDGEARGISDAAGRVNVRIRRHGMQVVGAGFEAPRNDRLADSTSHAAVLTFELPGNGQQ
jgi:nickel transport protein